MLVAGGNAMGLGAVLEIYPEEDGWESRHFLDQQRDCYIFFPGTVADASMELSPGARAANHGPVILADTI